MLRYGVRRDGREGLAAEAAANYVAATAGSTPSTDVIDGIEQALRGLSTVNEWLGALGDMSAGVVEDDVLQALLVSLGHIDSAVLAAVSRTIVLAEESGCAGRDGQASPAAWVAQQMRLTGPAATRACRLASDLDRAPAVLQSLEAGQISRDHAIGLAAAARQQRADQRAAERARQAAEREAAEERRRQAEADAAAARDEEECAQRLRQAQLAEHARQQQEAREAAQRAAAAERARRERQADLLAKARAGQSPDQISEHADQQRAQDPDALLRCEAAQRAGRFVRDWIDQKSGAGRGSWSLPISQHERVLAVLEAARTHDDPECEADERRTFEQRQADAFSDAMGLVLKAGDLPTSRGQKPHVSVTVPLGTLTGAGDQPGRTRFGNRLSAQAARRLACDAALTRIVCNATSQVLDVGRETRVWNVAQYRAAETTFGGCAFPVRQGEMCGRPPTWCDLHHIDYWRNGGPTDQANGALLCGRHHDAVHHDGWVLTYDHDGQTIAVTKVRHDGSTCRRTVNLARPLTPAPPRDAEAHRPSNPTPATGTPTGRAASTIPEAERLPL
ncbi:MAG TPA: DUF222 domain-containing protein [Euzebya sp.]|nr:DUF222 domain-containing protein [Euzebya sp.]